MGEEALKDTHVAGYNKGVKKVKPFKLKYKSKFSINMKAAACTSQATESSGGISTLETNSQVDRSDTLIQEVTFMSPDSLLEGET